VHSPDTKNKLRSAYIHKRLGLRAAADDCDVSYHTARSWKKKAKEEGDDWDKGRAASRMASGGLGDMTAQLLEDFALLFQSTVEEIRDGDHDALKKAEALSRLSDAYTKTMKAAAGGNPGIAKLAIAMDVLKMLAEFIKEQFPSDVTRFTNILEPFGHRLARELK
jgi:hypothetical protein